MITFLVYLVYFLVYLRCILRNNLPAAISFILNGLYKLWCIWYIYFSRTYACAGAHAHTRVAVESGQTHTPNTPKYTKRYFGQIVALNSGFLVCQQ